MAVCLAEELVWRCLVFSSEQPDWTMIPQTEHKGTSGVAFWRTQSFGSIRERIVDYSPGYVADHWCDKGHILFCLEGELKTELRDGRS